MARRGIGAARRPAAGTARGRRPGCRAAGSSRYVAPIHAVGDAQLALTSVHICVQASRCSAVRFGVKFVFWRIVGSSTENACLRVSSVLALITAVLLAAWQEVVGR